MAANRSLDQCPGPLPDIQMDGDCVTFTFDLADPLRAQLVVRCDPHGGVYAALAERQQRPRAPFSADE
jgi:hypothetical protein